MNIIAQNLHVNSFDAEPIDLIDYYGRVTIEWERIGVNIF